MEKIHGLIRLKLADNATGVDFSSLTDRCITKTSQLPDHLIELHVFSNNHIAGGFVEGIKYTGSNIISATSVGGPRNQLVIIAKHNEDRLQENTLEKCIPLVLHGIKSIDNALQQEADRVDELIANRILQDNELNKWVDIKNVLHNTDWTITLQTDQKTKLPTGRIFLNAHDVDMNEYHILTIRHPDGGLYLECPINCSLQGFTLKASELIMDELRDILSEYSWSYHPDKCCLIWSGNNKNEMREGLFQISDIMEKIKKPCLEAIEAVNSANYALNDANYRILRLLEKSDAFIQGSDISGPYYTENTTQRVQLVTLHLNSMLSHALLDQMDNRFYISERGRFAFHNPNHLSEYILNDIRSKTTNNPVFI